MLGLSSNLRRMIFGSKRERFVSNQDINQLRIEFEPKAAEVAETVKVEREKIRVEYERKKPKKEHKGRMALPSHLPVVETVVEPDEDTTGMVCIGREITEELDYTPAKLQVNRTIRPKYITCEDEKGSQKQVNAAQDVAMWYSFFATCQKNDIDPQKWLTYVIKNINDTKNSEAKYLLPQFIDKNLIE